MGRFAFPPKYGMRLNESGKAPSTLAFFTIIDTELGIEFRDVQLKRRNDGGHFVSSPYRTYEQDGETKYVNFWRAAYDEDEKAYVEAGVEYLEEMTEAALKKFKQLSAGGGDAPRASKKGGSKPAGRKSGRGPVVEESDDSDWGF